MFSPAPTSVAPPGRPQGINERRAAPKAHAKDRTLTDRIERCRVKKGEPGRPARAGRAALPAFPAALAGQRGQDKRGAGRTGGRLGLRQGLDERLACCGHTSRGAVQVPLKVGLRDWLLTYDEPAGAFRTIVPLTRPCSRASPRIPRTVSAGQDNTPIKLGATIKACRLIIRS